MSFEGSHSEGLVYQALLTMRPQRLVRVSGVGSHMGG
jgi:hypothetical protein